MQKRFVLSVAIILAAALIQSSKAWVHQSHLGITNLATRRRARSQTKFLVDRGFFIDTAQVSAQLRKVSILNASVRKDDNGGSLRLNVVHVSAWIALVVFAFSPFSPGTLGSDQDNAMLQAFLADPLNPGINSVFFVIFNLFGPMPVILASLLLPQQMAGKIPAGPFLIASSAIGYFALGPYLALRTPPESVQTNGWFTQNLAENKFISWVMVVFCILVYAPLPGALNEWTGFVDLLRSSRLAAVSTIDLSILYIVATKAISDDYRLRVEDDKNAATKVALATAVLPYLGAALYCALRPSLEGKVDKTTK